MTWTNLLLMNCLRYSALLSWAFWCFAAVGLYTFLEICWLSGTRTWRLLFPSKVEWLSWKIGRGIQKLLFPLTTKGVLLVVGFYVGMMYQRTMDRDRTNHMTNVDVIRKFDTHHYRILSEDVQRYYDIQLCPGEPPDWQEGMILTDLIYLQNTTCQQLMWYRQSRDVKTGKLIDWRMQ